MTYKPVDAAITMVVGPCIDDTDFKSLEEAIAYNAAGMDVSLIVEKTDGTTAVTAITLTTGGTSDWTHKDGGYYEIEVTAAQNVEEGVGYIRGVCTGVLPFESAHYNIVKANVYDSWVKGTDVLQTDLTQIGGTAQSATDLKDFADAGYDPGTNKITGTADMRGTDSAALAATALTDATWTDAKAGHLDAPISTVDTVADGIQTDLSNVTDGLGALKALLDTISGYTDKIDDATNGLTAIKAEVEGLAGAAMRGTDSANTTVPDAAGVAPTAAEIRQEMDANSTKMAPSQVLADYKATGFSTHDAADVKTAIEAAGSTLATILTDTNDLQTNQGAWATATGFSTHNAAAVWSVATRILTASTNFNDLTAAEMKAEVVAALADIKLDHLLNIAVDTDWATTVHLDSVIGHMADVGTAATFNRTTDALEALRNRGDAAWIAATGFSTHSAADVKTAIEQAGSSIATILTDTGELQTDWVNGGRLDNLLDAIPTTAMRGTDGANTVVPDVAGTLASYDPPTRTEATADKDTIIADLLTMKKTAAGAYDRDTDSLEAIRDRGDAAWSAAAGTPSVLIDTTINTVTDQTHFTLVAGSGVDDAYKDQAIVMYDVTNSDYPSIRKCTAYTGATKTVTIDSAPDFTIAGSDKVKVFVTAPGTTAPSAATVADAVWDEVLTGATHNITNSAGRRVRQIGAFAIHDGTAQGGTTNSITLAASANGADGIYNRNLIVLVDNTGAGQTRTIVDYDHTSKICVVDRDWRITPDVTTEYQIVPDDTPLTVDHGVAVAGTATTLTLRSYASDVDDIYLCNIITIIAGTGRGQARLVGAYDGANRVVTICGDDWITIPDTTSVYVMMPYGTTCTSCIGDHALGQIKSEADDALSDVNLDTHDQNIKSMIRSDY